jgi:hypothetical protein
VLSNLVSNAIQRCPLPRKQTRPILPRVIGSLPAQAGAAGMGHLNLSEYYRYLEDDACLLPGDIVEAIGGEFVP